MSRTVWVVLAAGWSLFLGAFSTAAARQPRGGPEQSRNGAVHVLAQAPEAAAARQQAPAPVGGTGAERLADLSPKPPYLPRRPEDQARGFILPVGYRMELVAADPDVISPAVIEFDGNGRMYVSELISYMMDADGRRGVAPARSDQPHQPLGEQQG
jgi:hypothetical protein